VGVLGGVNVATLQQTGARSFFQYDYNTTTRAAAGAMLEFRWGGRLALRLEPMYLGKGSSYLDPGCPCLRPVGYVPAHNDLRLSYLEMPVLLVVAFRSSAPGAYVVAGPTAGYLMSGTQQSDRGGGAQDATMLLRRWDAGLEVGGGVDLSAGRAVAFLEARYGFGLVNVYSFSGDATSHNRGLRVLGGVSYRIGRR
jgi:hypothetical protein